MKNIRPKVRYQDWGNISYQMAWDKQFEVQKSVIAHKMSLRNSADDPSVFAAKLCATQQNHLIFCEHKHVYTLGKSGSIDHLLLNEQQLAARGIEFFKINRGGDITYHGTGQITGYPIFDMECFFTDVHRYVRSIEEVMIRLLAEYGLEGGRIKEFTGVWLDIDSERKRKICAIGVHLSRWVSMHGFALNVNTDLSFFKNIVPCGIDDADKTVTSLATELGREVDLEEVKSKLRRHFSEVFEFEFLG